MSRTKKKNRIAALTSVAGRLANQPAPVMKRSELLDYKITDAAERCSWCRTPSAPVLIGGKNYCLWCVFAFCCDFLRTKKKAA